MLHYEQINGIKPINYNNLNNKTEYELPVKLTDEERQEVLNIIKNGM